MFLGKVIYFLLLVTVFFIKLRGRISTSYCSYILLNNFFIRDVWCTMCDTDDTMRVRTKDILDAEWKGVGEKTSQGRASGFERL